ncbi:hypothetical protein M3Y96_00431600 [Aphelenchoides besseyi]|nr:hypothetical protein M3Y96_00431600 [Aphelenchoides besseyi]
MRRSTMLLIFLVLITIQSAASSDNTIDSTTNVEIRRGNYKKFLTCVAVCGTLKSTSRTVRLMSGEEVDDWETNGAEFDSCKRVCEIYERYNSTAKPLESIEATDFNQLQVTCIEGVRMKPLRIKAKLFIQHQTPPPNETKLLHVVEVWRSIVNADGLIHNEIVNRHFTMSDRFVLPYEFAQNHIHERFFVRVFSFTQDGQFGRPQCSGMVAPDALMRSNREPLNLSVRPHNNEEMDIDFGQNLTTRTVELMWQNSDPTAPPECDQQLQWSTVQRIQNKWITLDSSHIIPLADINDNFTYLVRLISKRDFNGKMNLDAASSLVLRGAAEIEANHDDWTLYLDGYAGLLICTLIVMLLLAFTCSVMFLFYRRRERHRSANEQQKVGPKKQKKLSPHYSNSTINLATQQISPSRSSVTNDRDSGVESHKNDKDSWPDVIAIRPATAFDPRGYSFADREAQQSSPYLFTSTPRRYASNGVAIVQIPPGSEALV